MPENAIVVRERFTTEAGIYHRAEGARAHDYLEGPCGGTIGAGLPVARGAAMACPDRKVVLLQGDGSAMFTNQALWSMAMEKTDVTIVLMKNDSPAISPISWRPTISLAS
jgi:acetolactate synthase-1/2/3 large subunit